MTQWLAAQLEHYKMTANRTATRSLDPGLGLGKSMRLVYRTALLAGAMVCVTLLTLGSLILSPRDPLRSNLPLDTGEPEMTLSEKASLILTRVASGEAFSYGREPVGVTLVRTLPRTLAVNIPGILCGWTLGFLVGSFVGAVRQPILHRSALALLVLSILVPGPLWVTISRMLLVESGLFQLRLSGSVIPASLTIALLNVPYIALNHAVLIQKSVQQPSVLFARQIGMSTMMRWRYIILPATGSYWRTKKMILFVVLCEGAVLVESVYLVRGIGEAGFRACLLGDAALLLTLMCASTLLVGLGMVASLDGK